VAVVERIMCVLVYPYALSSYEKSFSTFDLPAKSLDNLAKSNRSEGECATISVLKLLPGILSRLSVLRRDPNKTNAMGFYHPLV
jgi:hypothetical protein